VLFRFDVFVLDESSRQLLKAGHEVHLSPKAFDLLGHLIRARPRAVSKTELHESLWPKTFVTDASLGVLVTEIRKALDDTVRDSRYVRTVHKFGYAFKGDVIEIDVPATARPHVVYWLFSPSRQIPLSPGVNVVGRDPQVTVWIDSPGISRQHARITIDGDRVTIEDLGSKNGTHVRGAAISRPTPLSDGDEIRFGSTGLTLRIWSPSDSTDDL
jgi:DNA-binding winged helix-turn-helix (wHTH) protein